MIQTRRGREVSLATLRMTPKQLRFQANYVIMHAIIEQMMVVLIAGVCVLGRSITFKQPLREAIGQSFSLATVQLVMELVTNSVAMYYESWAGVPVVEVWVQYRWRTALWMFLFMVST